MRIRSLLGLLAVLACSDSTGPVVPGRPPEIDGFVIERTQSQSNLRVLISESPGSPPCPMPGPVTAVYFDIRTADVYTRNLNGAFRRFPADSVVVGMHVRAWARGTPTGECPPVFPGEALEVIP